MDAVDTIVYVSLVGALIYALALTMEWWCQPPRPRCPNCGRRMRESYLTPGVWYCRSASRTVEVP